MERVLAKPQVILIPSPRAVHGSVARGQEIAYNLIGSRIKQLSAALSAPWALRE